MVSLNPLCPLMSLPFFVVRDTTARHCSEIAMWAVWIQLFGRRTSIGLSYENLRWGSLSLLYKNSWCLSLYCAQLLRIRTFNTVQNWTHNECSNFGRTVRLYEDRRHALNVATDCIWHMFQVRGLTDALCLLLFDVVMSWKKPKTIKICPEMCVS